MAGFLFPWQGQWCLIFWTFTQQQFFTVPLVMVTVLSPSHSTISSPEPLANPIASLLHPTPARHSTQVLVRRYLGHYFPVQWESHFILCLRPYSRFTAPRKNLVPERNQTQKPIKGSRVQTCEPACLLEGLPVEVDLASMG